MNMNVLIDGRMPKVSTLREVLRAFLDHRRDVLLRRAHFRLGKIADRLEVLGGYLIAYLNLDRVIAIIRTEDEPKAVLMAEFRLTDVQAEAILNMRLRNLRKLEEMEIRRELDALTAEQAGFEHWLPRRRRSGAGSPTSSVRCARPSARGRRAERGARPSTTRRRSRSRARGDGRARAGDGRAVGHGLDPGAEGACRRGAELKFKDGDGPGFFLHAETTDRLLIFASNGRMFTLACAGLPGGRGMGEPVRLMLDLPNEAQVLAVLVHRPGGRLLIASGVGTASCCRRTRRWPRRARGGRC